MIKITWRTSDICIIPGTQWYMCTYVVTKESGGLHRSYNMWTYVVMGPICTWLLLIYLICAIDSVKGFSRRRGYWSILLSIWRVCIYICSAGHVELPIVLLHLLRYLVYHMLSKTRQNSRSLHRVVAYKYMFGWLCRATCCSVVSNSLLGVSHGVQNEKKLWKFTQSDRWGIGARSTGGV